MVVRLRTWTNGLLFLMITCEWATSDFNVVIPEICFFPVSSPLNISWIHQTVLQGLRPGQNVNIFPQKEVCDGSEGLLKVLGSAHSEPSGPVIASLAPHLCPTAETFFRLRQASFISWTCNKGGGVESLKPSTAQVQVGVERLLHFFHPSRVGFTKFRADSASFCADVGAQLQTSLTHSQSNISLQSLGNLEDHTHRANNNLDSILVCMSYSYFLQTHLSNASNSHLALGVLERLKRTPVVLIPEWPIPFGVLIPKHSSPTYALLTNSGSSLEEEFQLISMDKLKNENQTMRVRHTMELLLSHLILKSVKGWLEPQLSTPHPQQPPLHFSILHYDKPRWEVVAELAGEDTESRKTHTPNDTLENNDSEEEDWLTWVQVLIATSAAAGVILSLICISLYARKRTRDSMYGSTTRRKLSRRLRSQGPYKVLLTSKDIAFGTMAPPTTEHNSKKTPLRSHSSGSEERPDLLKGSLGTTLRKTPSMKVETNLTGEHRGARYKGDLVHLKELPSFTEPLQVKMKAMTVLETLHGLRHENLAAMLGCLTEVSPGLIWEFCSRGSLHDILQQQDIKLDWAFKLSLLTDLVRGMRYLHLSMVRVHGSLTSFNCVVDARWVLKITNYGINGLLQAQGCPPVERSSRELLWVAPELLRDEVLRKTGTQPGDVYSFAIIMQEVLVRGEPYSMLTLTPQEILEKVKRPPPLIRPSVSKGAAPPEAINIMRQCWAELPDMRPDFMVIHDLFKTLNHGRKANIVDTMFQMLEKYSNNLEELIRERTEQLDLERKKTEQLLNRMLPSTVAEKLKMGLPVDPEEFSEVTIYFSDIVGFTTISAYSTPFEVVDLLNDLYTSFDATINDYNVYKVETIGDAYMVVGGAPIWSADHADQIATMALDLLHQSGKFRIRHLPFTPLRLRIGLHTGPCCAGVVGLTMPRYCLFGDTVNTASRMESTGSAWRIHISRETKAKLDSIGGYVIQYRGMTDIKGKGQLETFWLLGKDGFDKELPKPPGPNESVKLDEKSIEYGRTGKLPSSEPIKGNEFGESSPSGSQTTLNPTVPSKVQPKYCVLTGDNLRSLTPAEQVAYQLLNGKPVVRGLRRQFSLDQGANSHPLVNMKSFRKAPSLEDTCEHTSQQSPPSPRELTLPTPSSSSSSKAKDKDKTTAEETEPEPGGRMSSGGAQGHHHRLTATSPSLPVLEESPLASRRGRHKLSSTSLDN